MPTSGELNKQWGVYQNSCCGREIIIREGATFPDCPDHPKSPTTWNAIDVEVLDITIIKKESKEPGRHT